MARLWSDSNPLASGMQTPSGIMWMARDNHTTMHHLYHLVGWTLSQWTWDLRVPTLFSFNLSYCMLTLFNCSAVPACVPVLNPDSEADCMHPCALFTSPSPSPPCRLPPWLQMPPGLHP